MLSCIPTPKSARLFHLALGLASALPAWGQVWTLQQTPIKAYLQAVAAWNAQVVYATGDSGRVYKTMDGGAHWNLLGATGFTNTLGGIAVTGPDTAYVCGLSGNIAKTVDGGVTWKHQTSGTQSYLVSLSVADARTLYACGTRGTLVKTSNGGATWDTLISGVTSTLSTVSAVDANIAYVAGIGDTLLKTVDGGKTWTAIKVGTPAIQMMGISAVDADTVFAIERIAPPSGVQATATLRTTDGGKTWTRTDRGYSAWLYAVSAVNGKVAFAVGFDGSIIKTSDGGATWQAQSVKSGAWFEGVQALDENTVYAVGSGGTIAKYGPSAGLRPPRSAGRFLAGLEGGFLRVVMDGKESLSVRALGVGGRELAAWLVGPLEPGSNLLPLPGLPAGLHLLEVRSQTARVAIPAHIP